MSTIVTEISNLIKTEFLATLWLSCPDLTKHLSLKDAQRKYDAWIYASAAVGPVKPALAGANAGGANAGGANAGGDAVSTDDVDAITGESIDGMKLTALRAICAKIKLPTSGTRQMLKDRIADAKGLTLPIIAVEPKRSALGANKKKKSMKVPDKPNASLTLKMHGSAMVDEKTGIAFDENKVAIGYEADEYGVILPLTSEKLETCKEYGFEYIVLLT